MRVTFTITTASGGRNVDDAISSTESGAQTITFSDARGTHAGASLKPVASYLMAPTSGSASNVVSVTVVDQYGKPVRGHLVRLSSNHQNPTATTDADLSSFPVARRTDSSGTVRIGYSHTGTGSVEALVANTSVTTAGTEALTPLPGGTANFYWARPAMSAADVTRLETAAAVQVSDADSRTLVIGGDASTAPLIVRYDGNDQFAVGDTAGSEPLTDMAGFEAALAKDKDNNDTVTVTSYDPTDAGDVARFVLTVWPTPNP